MPYGRTIEMLLISRAQAWRRPEPRETRERDRSLRGKARRRARKANQRAERNQA